MSKWILIWTLMIGFQVQAEVAATDPAAAFPQAEIAVVAPAAATAQDAVAAVPMKELKESEIPVNLESTKKAESNEHPVFKILLSFGIIGILGCAAYFLIRKYRFQNPRSQATQIKVLTQHYLGPKKSLAIVRVAGESVLIGITDHNISMIKSLALLDEDIPEDSPKEFHAVFAKKTAAQSPTASQTAPFADDGDGKDEFSISGIKDIVSGKLKNMRSLE